MKMYTPPKSNIDTKNDGFLKCISFQIWAILGIHVSFQGYTSPFRNTVIFQQLAMFVLGVGIFFLQKTQHKQGEIPWDQHPRMKDYCKSTERNHIQQVKDLSKLLYNNWGCPRGKKRCNKWDIYHINWLAGFLPSTEVYCSSIPAGMVHVLASLVMKTNHGDDLGCSCFSPQDAIVESIKVLGWDSQSPK